MRSPARHTLVVLLALFAVLACLLWAAESRATTIIAPAGSELPYQAWIDEAEVPTPEATLTVVEDNSRCEGLGSACTVEGEATVWIDLTPFGGTRIDLADVRETLFHEVGHQASYRMAGWALTRFQTMRRDPRPWRQAPNAPVEQFAEAWRLCAEGARGRVEGGYKYRASEGMQRRVCRLIRLASASDAFARHGGP